VVAALTFSGPSSRFTDTRVDELTADLKSAAKKLSERGFDHPLRTPAI
jgi:DNA-binding IclR family transcriptional regulator